MADQTSPSGRPDADPSPTYADGGREGHSERAGEGGYGNDTGFATGTQGSREADGGGAVDAGTSAREEQTSNTYRDAGQGQGA